MILGSLSSEAKGSACNQRESFGWHHHQLCQAISQGQDQKQGKKLHHIHVIHTFFGSWLRTEKINPLTNYQ